MSLKIILADTNYDLIKAWKQFFKDIPFVKVYHGSILDNACDAIVSPANSFGFMNGGLDLILSEFLGWHVQTRVQNLIRDKYHGELVVGQADIVETDNKYFPYLISAPTMRVPMLLKDSVNSYLAMRALLLLITKGKFSNNTLISDKVKSVAISGLGTGVGNVPPNVCARQMRIAVGQVLLKEILFPLSCFDAMEIHDIIVLDR